VSRVSEGRPPVVGDGVLVRRVHAPQWFAGLDPGVQVLLQALLFQCRRGDLGDERAGYHDHAVAVADEDVARVHRDTGAADRYLEIGDVVVRGPGGDGDRARVRGARHRGEAVA